MGTMFSDTGYGTNRKETITALVSSLRYNGYSVKGPYRDHAYSNERYYVYIARYGRYAVKFDQFGKEYRCRIEYVDNKTPDEHIDDGDE